MPPTRTPSSSSSAAPSATDETDLPDGSCISPRRLVKSLNLQDSTNATVEALYAGSFPVVGENQDECMECVRRMLLEMKSVGKTRPVLLAISLSGIKVCSHTGESILMAHALRRISYTTCHPEFCQFSFLAREPKADTSFQHCHVFITKNPQEAEELNGVVASAFSVAYALQRRSQVVDRPPTFNELIGRQLDAQREEEEEEGLRGGEFTRQRRQERLTQRLGDISTSLIGRRLEERHRMRQQQRQRTAWAKHTGDRASCDCLLPDNEHQGSPLPVISSSFQEVIFQQKSQEVSEGLCHPEEASGPILCSDHLASGVPRTLQGTDDDGPSEEEEEETDYLCPASCGLEIPRMDATGSQLEFHICHHMAEEEEQCLSDEGNTEGAGHSPQQQCTTTDRPLSGKYQNDARDSSGSGLDSSEGRDIYQGPPTPIRHDSLRKMTTLQGMPFDDPQEAAWYQPGLPREKTLELLAQQDIGSFVIRDSTTHPGCFALSVKVPRYDNPTGISHYLITRTAKGCFKMKGLEKEWQTLDSLVTHHTVMWELLPCLLLLHLPRSFNSLLSRDLDKEGGNY